MCYGKLTVDESMKIATCDFCGITQTLPWLNNDRIVRLYDRASHFRRNSEFEKASVIYEEILNENNEDSEAYWSLVLSSYGVEYVDDPKTGRRVPTVNRARFTSIFDDDNYKLAIKYADLERRALYEKEAAVINDIQKGILEISRSEEGFDIFICYKESDESGRRTRDSVMAEELYNRLTEEGYRVFFSRITLEGKLGEAYEPYIFAALNSAKIMIVLGTSKEHFNAPWVKNEWGRYLPLIEESRGRKSLIPAYEGMSAYDLPKEFSHLQAQDMSKIGFMQDLLRGVKKLMEFSSGGVEDYKATDARKLENIELYLKRAELLIGSGNFDDAVRYCERVIDIDPENADAYIFRLMAKLRIKEEKMLAQSFVPLTEMNDYINAVRFSDPVTTERLMGYNSTIVARLAKGEGEKKEKPRYSLSLIICSLISAALSFAGFAFIITIEKGTPIGEILAAILFSLSAMYFCYYVLKKLRYKRALAFLSVCTSGLFPLVLAIYIFVKKLKGAVDVIKDAIKPDDSEKQQEK